MAKKTTEEVGRALRDGPAAVDEDGEGAGVDERKKRPRGGGGKPRIFWEERVMELQA